MSRWLQVWEPKTLAPSDSLRSLILGFPTEITSQIVGYLPASHIMRLLQTGSMPVRNTLLRKSVVKSFVHHPTKNGISTSLPPVSFLQSFSPLSTIDIKHETAYVKHCPYRISAFPATLTFLRIDHPLSLSFFESPSSKPIKPQWLSTRDLLPNLQHLTVLKWARDYSLYRPGGLLKLRQWLDSLPDTLLSFEAPFITFDDIFYNFRSLSKAERATIDIDALARCCWDTLLPPNLTALDIDFQVIKSRYSPVSSTDPSQILWTNALIHLPPRITSFGQPLNLPLHELGPIWPWMRSLRLNGLHLTSDNARCFLERLPRSLTSLKVEKCYPSSNYASYLPEHSKAELLLLLPTNLTVLRIPNLRCCDLKWLPNTLTHLILSTMADNHDPLPRNLRYLKVEFLLSSQAPTLPPLLESFAATRSNHPFLDTWLPLLPPSLNRLEMPKWLLRGFLVSSTSTNLDERLLIRHLKIHPFIHFSLSPHIRVAPLSHLPPQTTYLDGLSLEPEIPLSQLPRGLIALPQDFKINDFNDNDVRDIPKAIKQLKIGALRLPSWLALWSPNLGILGGHIAIRDKDIRSCLEEIDRQSASTGINETSINIPSSIWPLIRAQHEEELQQSPEFALTIASKLVFAFWRREHFALLPPYVEYLSIVPPPNALEPSFKSTSSHASGDGAALEPIEWPPSLTSLILGAPAHELSYRVTPSSPSIFSRFGIKSSLELPLTLEHLELYPIIRLNELEHIGRFTRLRTLILDQIVENDANNRMSKISESQYTQLLRSLPPQLEKLHLLAFDVVLKCIQDLPRGLLDVKLVSLPLNWQLHHIELLPPTLKKLCINSTTIPSGYLRFVPDSLELVIWNLKPIDDPLCLASRLISSSEDA